jgi:alkylation response protein AidB-like acyl-CoA dehydrogenase
MRRRPLEERDLRSLQRRSMNSIFGALDPDERLPRELVREAKRHRYFSVKWLEVAGFLYIPALMLLIIGLGSLNIPLLIAFGVAGVALVGCFVYAMIGEWR